MRSKAKNVGALMVVFAVGSPGGVSSQADSENWGRVSIIQRELVEQSQHPKVAALGIASTPANERDPDGLSLAAAYNLIKGALLGVQQRSGS